MSYKYVHYSNFILFTFFAHKSVLYSHFPWLKGIWQIRGDSVSTPTLLFPAISLLLPAYTNRFMGVTRLIRQLRRDRNEENYKQ